MLVGLNGYRKMKIANQAVQPIPYRATFCGSVRMSRASKAGTSHAKSWAAVGDG